MSAEASSRRASLEPPGLYGRREGTGFVNGLYDEYDPRSTSTQSLVPSPPDHEKFEDRKYRKLLVVYIHGFLGNDASFQHFPAHVHKYLKAHLSDTHIIHTKIYPRYKTYKAIELARDNLSRWLSPHESPTTDVILIGHSMGGLLGADLALMPALNPHMGRFFQHRILGTVCLDSPLLSLDPGIIRSGIASLFRSKGFLPKAAEDSNHRNSFSAPMPGLAPVMTFDPNFNPAFRNDVHIMDRGWWKNVVHFVKKHNSEGLVDAATHHILSHMEFGSVLMDYSCLKQRYANIRRLEDVDDIKYHGFPNVPSQIRFIQFYTVCHGFPKKRKVKKQAEEADSTPSVFSAGNRAMRPPLVPRGSLQVKGRWKRKAKVESPTDAREEPRLSDNEAPGLIVLDPLPIPDDSQAPEPSIPAPPDAEKPMPQRAIPLIAVPEEHPAITSLNAREPPEVDGSSNLGNLLASLTIDLPPIPDLPESPQPPDLDIITDMEARKQAEREAKQRQKDYEQAARQYDKALRERERIIDKRRRKHVRDIEKQEEACRMQQHHESQLEAAATSAALDQSSSLGKAAASAQPCSNAADAANDSSAPRQQARFTPITPDPAIPSRASSLAMSVLREVVSCTSTGSSDASQRPPGGEKKRKERRFCRLPKKVNGQHDTKWNAVFMEDTDEIGAHTGLFMPGPHHDKLVEAVGSTLVDWVLHDMHKRAILHGDRRAAGSCTTQV